MARASVGWPGPVPPVAERAVLFVNLRGVPAEDRAALIAARRLGYAVDLVAPSLPAHARGLVREFLAVNTDDLEQGLRGARKLADHAKPSGVLTWGDRGVELVALIGADLGLPTLSTQAAHRVRHKPSMRDATAARAPGLVGRHRAVSDRADLERAMQEVGFPAVLKPAAAAGSMGIFEVGDRDQAERAFDRLSGWLREAPRAWRGTREDGELILDEFLGGPEFSVEGWVHEGAVTIAGITDKWTTDPFHLEYQHVHPARMPEADQEVLRDGTEQVVRALELDHCTFHLECKLTPKGFRLIEVAGRPAGDFIASHLIPLSTGIDFHANCIRVACDEPPIIRARDPLVAGVRFLLANREGVYRGLDGLDEVLQPGTVEHVFLEIPVGTTIRLPPADYDTQRVAAIVTRSCCHETVLTTLDTAARRCLPLVT
jgi:biotin carboxylase